VTRADGHPAGCACRRQVLAAGIGAALLAVAGPARSDEAADPDREAHPQPGDQFVFFEGERQGQVINPEDIKPGGPQVLAWPYIPAKKVPRDGSRLNQVLLIRFDAAQLSDDEKPHAADGIVAFSAICTHAGCLVTAWMAKEQLLLCPCHGSEYNPKDLGKAVFGPAPRRLAALPLKISDGVLAAAGEFIGRVGIAPMT
jgi:rieske iron-sulfur protein